MASLDMTSADAALKQLYRKENFQFATYDRRPMIGSLPKDEGFYGRNMPIVIEYTNPQGVSATFSDAQANTTAAGIQDFLLTRVNEHSVATIDGETLDAMSNDAGAFVTAMKAQADAALRSLADRLESLAPGTATGALGQVGSLSTTTLTLKDVNDVHRFEVGMSLVASDGGSAEGAALEDSGAVEVVAGVNRREGKLESTSVDWTTLITALDADDYLYAEGDAKAAGTLKVTMGFDGWLPATAPTTGDSFFGVDRSVDSRLYGMTHTATGLVKTGLIDGQSKASENGGKVDLGWLHHTKYRELCKEIDSQTEYQKIPAKGVGGRDFAAVSYTGVSVLGDEGPITILAANKMKGSVSYLIETALWKYCSIKSLVRWNMADGNRALRQTTSDGVECRFVSRANIGCKVPGWNCRVSFT